MIEDLCCFYIRTYVYENFYKTLDLFKSAGCEIKEISIPTIGFTPELYTILSYTELASNLARYDGVRYGYRTDKELKSLDDLYYKTKAEGYCDNIKKRILLGYFFSSSENYEKYFLKAQKVRRKLTNEFLNVFEPQFFGATEILPVGEFPKEIKYLDVGDDYSDLQGIIKDFEYLYRNYYEFIHLSKKDYGYCVINDSAVSLAQFDGKSIYGINNYKNGYVFYTNPMLPNVFSINGFSMERRNEDQTYFANSTASANQIILGEFLSFASKKIYGYAVERVLASFASPAASWQLHYEEITGIENDSAILFGELCKIYNQIPSYTLIRNSYKWHERAESVTYYINDDNKFNMDYNQSAYSSGTHVIMENSEYLRYNSISDPQTYFKDLKQYTQTAYIEITDVNKDKEAMTDIFIIMRDKHLKMGSGMF